MTNNLQFLLDNLKKERAATDAGNRLHSCMRHIVIDGDNTTGDNAILNKIFQCPSLIEFFIPASQTEVPIAGHINGKFVSRRIDRLIIDNDKKTIKILDYKSDTDKQKFLAKYTEQITEYKNLMQDIYPGYTIRGYILWLHDFSLIEIK